MPEIAYHLLPTDIDATHPDDTASALAGARKDHQRHHDTVHEAVVAIGAAWNAAVTGGFAGTFAQWVATWDDAGADDQTAAEVAFSPTGTVAATTVQAAIAEVAVDAAAGSAAAQAFAVERANHTGTQSADTVIDGITNHVFTAADDTKLGGVATAATANSTDAALRDRTTHTGVQPVSTVDGLQAALDAKSTRATTKQSVSAAYTLVAADATDRVLHVTSATAITITLPQDSAATIAQEVAIPWRQYGAGQVTFAAGTGATVLSRGNAFKSAGQYAEGVATKVAANVWLVSGDSTT